MSRSDPAVAGSRRVRGAGDDPCGGRICDAFVGGRTAVRKNIPPYVKAAREPLSFIGVNTIGLRRRGFSDEQIMNIEDIYRIIYVQNSNITTALKIVDIEMPASAEKDHIIEFIKDSTKGIMRGLS